MILNVIPTKVLKCYRYLSVMPMLYRGSHLTQNGCYRRGMWACSCPFGRWQQATPFFFSETIPVLLHQNLKHLLVSGKNANHSPFYLCCYNRRLSSTAPFLHLKLPVKLWLRSDHFVQEFCLFWGWVLDLLIHKETFTRTIQWPHSHSQWLQCDEEKSKTKWINGTR